MINGIKKIEVGKGHLGYFIFEKDWVVKEGLSEDKFLKRLTELHKKYPDYEIKITTFSIDDFWLQETVKNIVATK